MTLQVVQNESFLRAHFREEEGARLSRDSNEKKVEHLFVSLSGSLPLDVKDFTPGVFSDLEGLVVAESKESNPLANVVIFVES